MLDVEGGTLPEIADQLTDELVKEGMIKPDDRGNLIKLLQSKHKYVIILRHSDVITS